jgi:hypothetical protein
MKQRSIIIMSIFTLTASTTTYSASTKKISPKMDTTKEIERENQTSIFMEGSKQTFGKDDAIQLALLAAAAYRRPTFPYNLLDMVYGQFIVIERTPEPSTNEKQVEETLI